MEINSISASAMGTKSTQGEVKSPELMKTSVNAGSSAVSPAPNSEANTVDEIAKQAEVLNQKLLSLGQSLSFTVDESTQNSVVKVIDKTTDEVIRQFPTEGSLKIMQNIQNYLSSVQQQGLQRGESLTGVLFNEII